MMAYEVAHGAATDQLIALLDAPLSAGPGPTTSRSARDHAAHPWEIPGAARPDLRRVMSASLGAAFEMLDHEV